MPNPRRLTSSEWAMIAVAVLILLGIASLIWR
jgi:hypothetical protein